MQKQNFKYIFGPVYSWRLGTSLGIDPITRPEKVCNFNCVYCQLGATESHQMERKEFVLVDDVMKEIKALPPAEIDYYTFSGRGEPTLAKNLGSLIDAVHAATKGKVAVITNAGLVGKEDVREDLCRADFVLAKLDACDAHSLKVVSRPHTDIHFEDIVEGLKEFKKKYKGKFALQIMFVGHNKAYAQEIAKIAGEIGPDEIQINTPLRPSDVPPLSEEELKELKKHFKASSVTTVYEAERREIQPLDEEKTALRHGNAKKGEDFS